MYVGKEVTYPSNLISENDFKPKALQYLPHSFIFLSTYSIYSQQPRIVALLAKATIIVNKYGRVEIIIRFRSLMLLWAPTSQSWHWGNLSLGFSFLLWKWGQEDLPGRLVRKVFDELSRSSHQGAHMYLSSVPGAVGGSKPRKLIHRV